MHNCLQTNIDVRHTQTSVESQLAESSLDIWLFLLVITCVLMIDILIYQASPVWFKMQ